MSYDYETYRVNTALVGNELCTGDFKHEKI